MNDEKLIELVRNSPVLYDLSNPKYMNTEFKNTIWNRIGAEMKTTASSCRTRWGNIRDNFRKSLKKNKTVSGQKAKNTKLYKYAEQLSFLKKFFEERETRTNIDDEVINQDSTCVDDVDEYLSRENEENTEDYTTEDNNPVTVESQGHTSSNSRQTGSMQCPIPRKKTKQSVADATPRKTAAATVMEYLVKKNESMGSSSSPSQQQQQHPVDAFLTGIAPALKTLSPKNWHYAKADIFAAVQKYEFKMLMDQQQFAESSRFSSSCSTPICVHSEESSPAESYHQTTSTNEYRKTASPDRSQQTTSFNNTLLRLEVGGYHQYTSENEFEKTSTTDRNQQTTLPNHSLQQYYDYSG